MKAIGKNLLILSVDIIVVATEGGLMLHIKDREDLRYSKAKVIQTGLDVKGVKNDDIIFYDKHAGFKIELDNVEYRVITDSAIVIVL
jgi:co-chaperonin GroES (HSP10)